MAGHVSQKGAQTKCFGRAECFSARHCICGTDALLFRGVSESASKLKRNVGGAIATRFSVDNLEAGIQNAEAKLQSARQRLLGAAAMGAIIVSPIMMAANFSSEMANVSTLIDTTVESMDAMKSKVLEIAGRPSRNGLGGQSGHVLSARNRREPDKATPLHCGPRRRTPLLQQNRDGAVARRPEASRRPDAIGIADRARQGGANLDGDVADDESIRREADKGFQLPAFTKFRYAEMLYAPTFGCGGDWKKGLQERPVKM
nr:hypothetical protein [Marinicella sp. W31]MDC2879005.1 hypothetical protein [Marinicella sp. W31]